MANAKNHQTVSHERVIPLDDVLLLELVTQKGEMVDAGRSLSRQAEDLAKQHEKVVEQMTAQATLIGNKKLDIMRRVQKLAKGLLGEFEIPITTELRDGKVVLIVSEALEEFKDSFKSFDKWREPAPISKKEKERMLPAKK